MNEEKLDRIRHLSEAFSVLDIIQCSLAQPRKRIHEEEKGRARPSEFVKQMLMTSEERIEFILKSRYKPDLSRYSKTHDPNFDVTPSIVIFQRFNSGEVLNATITVRNVSQVIINPVDLVSFRDHVEKTARITEAQVSRYLKTCCDLNPFFSVENRGSFSTMIAPGLSNSYTLKFIPENKIDYQYRLRFATNVGEIVVPIIAIGPRGILDFPDRIELPTTAVKIMSSKTIFVRNVGHAPTVFTIYSDRACFGIEPSKGRLEEEETLQFTVRFSSRKAGDFEGRLCLEYETGFSINDRGERLDIDVCCSAENLPIRVDRSCVRMEETYLGLSRSKTLTIHNGSDHIVKFKWMLLKDLDADEQRRAEYRKLFHLVYESELVRSADLVHYNVCLPDIHQLVYQRIYTDEIESLKKETFPYNNISFMLSPEEGEIWPQSSTDITVLFRALEVGEISNTAYLESVHLKCCRDSLCGTGKGPYFRLNVLTIDMCNVYLCSVHNFEVVVANKGHIPGTLIYKPKPSDFGGMIEVTPTLLCLKPDEHKSFNLRFTSNRKGDFVERLDFIVKESLEVHSLHIKGCIVFPELRFDKETLEFDETPLGFSNKRDVYLHNLSLVPVTFSLRMLNDGHQAPLTHEEFAKAQTKPSFPSNPREFFVTPKAGVISANGFCKLKVIYTANIVGEGETKMEVDLWDTDSDALALTIKFCGVVASLSIVPREILSDFCFLNHPCTKTFAVVNASDYDGFFYLQSQLVSESHPTIYSVSTNQGLVKAGQRKAISVTIIATVLGEQTVSIHMLTLGEESPKVACNINYIGQGALVSTEPTVLNLGEISVLEDTPTNFLVINNSPIPAQFTVSMEKPNLLWSVDPDSGYLEPNKSMKIDVKLRLRDVGKFYDKILLIVVGAAAACVELRAFGVGCSVVFEPHIFPVYDLGFLFSHQKVHQTITLKNYGTNAYQIVWSNTPHVQLNRGQLMGMQTAKFEMKPLVLEIEPEEEKVVDCELFWEKNECVTEDWYVFGKTLTALRRELIGVSTFKATLNEPQIFFNKKELRFRVDVCPYDDVRHQTEELVVTNRSKLHVNARISVKAPFRILTNEEKQLQHMKIILYDGQATTIRLFFSVDGANNLYSRNYVGVLQFEYDEHPSKDKIVCKGFVNLPNLVLEPANFTVNCELGSSAEKILTLTNNGPVSVVYKFLWTEDSIEIERGTHSDCDCSTHTPDATKLPAPDAPASAATAGDTFMNDRQDGSGDGPSQSIQPPVNSPVSEEHPLQLNSSSTIRDMVENICTVSEEELRNFLLPIVETYFTEDADLAAFETMRNEPPRSHYINDILEIIPRAGIVPPFTKQHVHVGFHGFEQLRIKATAICEILRGPAEVLQLCAQSDAIRFTVDADTIDFGQQLLLEQSHRSFTLKNTSEVAFGYKVTGLDNVVEETVNSFDISPLMVEPSTGFVDALSSVEFDVKQRSTTLGPIDHRFQLEVGHLMPVTITVNAFGSFPQLYPCIPRGNLHPQLAIESEYAAIGTLTDEFLANVGTLRSPALPCHRSDIFSKLQQLVTAMDGMSECKPAEKRADLPEDLVAQLSLGEGWSVVSYEDKFPRVVDVEMAVERHLARNLVDGNSYILIQHAAACKREPIPHLLSFEYVIGTLRFAGPINQPSSRLFLPRGHVFFADMGYVIAGQVADYTTKIVNYGPWRAGLRLKKLESPKKMDIVVHFKRRANLMVGDSANLRVVWHPSREKYRERCTPITHTVYIEVGRGCTIPIIVRGMVTYPYVTVSTKFLDFQDVVVGECLLMYIQIKNEGFVDCEWKIKLTNMRKKQHDHCPFHVEYDSNCCAPGQSEVVRIYFRPRKACYAEMKLNVLVKMSSETPTVVLTGRCIEKTLSIAEPVIRFLPVVPYTHVQDAVFAIENASDYPVELFWHHIDRSFQIDDQVINTLLDYYGVEEILLPPREPGEPLPANLIKFYNDLGDEMARVRWLQELEQEEYPGSESRLERRSYTESLHDAADFRGRMGDPVKELFESIEQKSGPLNDLPDPARPEKKVCIIFHGAPFTEYQEAACRSARVLAAPVLSIDKAITEAIALGESEYSITLRQIIDDAYQNYTERHKKLAAARTIGKTDGPDGEMRIEEKPKGTDRSKRKSPRSEKSAGKDTSPEGKKQKRKKSPETEAPHAKQEVILLPLPEESDPSTELNKIPEADRLETMDPLSRYEYMIQAILQFEKILGKDYSAVSSTPRDKLSPGTTARSAKKNVKSTFLGIDPKLLTEALAERLSAEDFKRGFVLQSLESKFLNDVPVETLLALLRIVGHAAYFLFVTFLNSMANYNRKTDELRRELGETRKRGTCKKIQGNRVHAISRTFDKIKAFEFARGPDLRGRYRRGPRRSHYGDTLRGNGALSMIDWTRNETRTRFDLFATEKTTDPEKRIRDIDEMSLSEYEPLADEDKKMYLEAILPAKRERASLRRARFAERMMERRKKKGAPAGGTVPRSKTPMGKGKEKSAKLKQTDNKKSASSKQSSGKRETPKSGGTKSRDSSKRGRETVPKEVAEIAAAMNQYQSDLSAMLDLIRSWDPLRKTPESLVTTKTKASKSEKAKDGAGDEDRARTVAELQTFIVPDTIWMDDVNKFHVWYANASDPWQGSMYDAVVAGMANNDSAKSALEPEPTPQPDLSPKMYSVLTARNIQERSRRVLGDVYELVSLSPAPEVVPLDESVYTAETSVPEKRTGTRRSSRRSRHAEEQRSAGKLEDRSLITSTIESRPRNVSVAESVVEEPLKPRWILQPNETQRFKVRFQPTETGDYDELYAITIPDGRGVTYEVKVHGVADIPTLDMDLEAIFGKVEETGAVTDRPAYFVDRGVYDFGSILVLPKDKRFACADYKSETPRYGSSRNPPYRRDAELKFRNISKVEAELSFSLAKNSDDCYTIQPENLLIDPGDQGILTLSAIATRLGTNSASLYLCIKNNPKAEVFRLQSEGTKLNIELDRKQISFGTTLLYRREFQVLTIRNNNGTELLWCLEPEEPLDPQITFSPDRGAIKPWNEQRIEFCYHGTAIGVIKTQTMTFKASVYEDQDPIFTDTIRLSGETYDVAVDIDHANPIDLKRIKVNVPASGLITMKNRGDYEVQFVIMLEESEKLSRLNLPVNLKKSLEVRPTSGIIPPNVERVVEVVIVTTTELSIKEAPILKCHLVDTNKDPVIVAEIPLTVSLEAYYTRFRVDPYPLMNFGTMAICTEKTMYLSIENTGKFPLHYTVQLTQRHPSMLYQSRAVKDVPRKKKTLTARTAASKKSKKSVKIKASDVDVKCVFHLLEREQPEPTKLVVGPMTVYKTEGDVDVGQTETIGVTCRPEFVGTQDEQILIQVNDSVPEDSDGKIVSLSVRSSVPCVDFEDVDSMFQENHVVDRIQDFDCPREIGAHTVFTRQEKCLYFRYVCVSTTHATCFKLYNRNVVPADVQVSFTQNSLTPKTAKPDTFSVEPAVERIPPSSYKTFTVYFTPATIETFQGSLEVSVFLPLHLAEEKMFVKLTGESCVPEVEVIEPPHGKRENATLNFGRTLVNETSCRQFALENVGFVKAKVIIEVDEDQKLFTFEAQPDTQHFLQIWDSSCDEPSDRCTVVLLMPGNVARFKVRFSPIDVEKHDGKIRVFIVDNPYENLVIDLKAEAYRESIILEGLEFEGSKPEVERDAEEMLVKGRKLSWKRSSVMSDRLSATFAVPLSYILDYGLCFVGKMYRKTFKISNKSVDKWFRFQWNAHPNLVFVPTAGHVKHQTYKEIVATFLGPEPVSHTNTRMECIVNEIDGTQLMNGAAWDDRQTEVRWEKMYTDIEQPKNVEVLAKKTVQPAPEPAADTIPGTNKSIQVVLTAIVAFSEYSCPVQNIYFKDTLMFQTRVYTFVLSNPGSVNTTYIWKISMDEQYPRKYMEDSPNVTVRPKTAENSRSRPNSRSFRGVFSATSERSNYRDLVSRGKSSGDAGNAFSRRCTVSPIDTFELKAPSARPSDLFSSSACLSERTTDSWLEGDDLPFTIHPEEGSIPPRESIECTLKFSPMDVFYYKVYLTCKMENLDPGLPMLTIPVVARSLVPYCHFDVEESDYVTSGRRDPKRPGPLECWPDDSTLWQNIRVIEFKVVGVGETHVKNFHLVNPTTEDYRFTWTDRTHLLINDVPDFHCTVPEGIAERGKQTNLAFTFLAKDVGVFESFWLFSIERYNLECLFLVVGTVTEPSVHCLTVHVKLKPTILGESRAFFCRRPSACFSCRFSEHNVQESIRLLNDETFDIPFRILDKSLYSEGKFQKLTVTPMAGVLASKTEQLLRVEYHPTRVGEFHFSVQCAVRLMKSPLTVFVTASVHEIVSSVTYSVAAGEIVRACEDTENVIDLGKLVVNVPITVKFDISNSSEMTFHYVWDLGMTPVICSRNAYSLETPQRQGHVTRESRLACDLILTSFQKTVIKDHRVALKISNGPTYRFLLKATSKKIAVQFSFNRYDFGPCYVQTTNGSSHRAELRVTNSEKSQRRLECNFEDQPHLSVDLNPISEAVAVRSTIAIPVTFRPLKETKYRECLIFKINSVNEKRIVITGEGIPYRIRLVNPRDKSIDLGSIPVGKTAVRRIGVLNEGLAAVDARFDLTKHLSAYEQYRDREKACTTNEQDGYKTEMEKASIVETKRSWTDDTELQTKDGRIMEFLQIQPSSITLHPNKKVDVTVRYKPAYRVERFTRKVGIQMSSTIFPLFMVHASCVGMEFRLNGTLFSFGTIVEGCARQSKVVLMNTGDIGARFKWNTSKLPADFTITPLSGYCSPGMDVNFVIKFQPSRQSSLIEGVATVEIEKYDSFKIKVTGGCCKLPEPIETIVFASVVRQRQMRAVNVANNTNLPWKLLPEVTGDYFSVEESFHVPARELGYCMVTYTPAVMNTEDTQHTGTLLIKLPDEGTPLIYALRGSSLPPEALTRIHRQFPAKTKYTELLPVHNWLDKQQRFHCKIEPVLTAPIQANRIPVFNFSGNERIDVPANKHRDYRAVFYSFEEYNFHFKVTFINEDNEYQFYEIEYNVTEPDVLESIKLSTSARSLVCHNLTLENPLDQNSITYTAECLDPFVTILGAPKVVSPLSSEHVTVQYHPMLQTEETVVKLDIYCQELGHFPYELRLKAAAALPEKVTRVNAILGTTCTFPLPVTNGTTHKAVFTIQVDNGCFASRKQIEVAESSNGTIEVTYEPYCTENVAATLTASSQVAGIFVFPLIGASSLPKPSGPYIVTQKSPVSIRFKNVFKETKTFEFFVDAPAVFALDKQSATLDFKKYTDVNVRLLGEDQKSTEEQYPVTGKLVIYCTEHGLSDINWVYYLRGIFE
ncbi:hydrocephalus-inducing protein homolog [Halictus rubicundus]|uniref:hydrocephalus-inducing protein homolog n=1 Tax=Halictus rubicundus TaxID=77578 RepID=UPI004036F2B6